MEGNLTFTKSEQSGREVWTASIEGVTGVINIDIERKGGGKLFVAAKQSNSAITRYKLVHVFTDCGRDLNFNFANEADTAELDVKLVSYSEVENANYN